MLATSAGLVGSPKHLGYSTPVMYVADYHLDVLDSTLLAARRILTMIARAGKLAGLDKKLSRSLEADVQEASSPMELGKSPLGPLSESSRSPLSPSPLVKSRDV